MNAAETMQFIDQIDRFAALAEIDADQGLTNDSLDFAQFWAEMNLTNEVKNVLGASDTNHPGL